MQGGAAARKRRAGPCGPPCGRGQAPALLYPRGVIIILLRQATVLDLPEILRLFHDTVHSVCSHDYSLEQLDTWAPKQVNEERWRGFIEKNIFCVAEIEGRIAGFGDMTPGGVINLLHADKDHQRKGVASAILSALEAETKKLGLDTLITAASVTAKPFFEHRGYRVALQQEKKDAYISP